MAYPFHIKEHLHHTIRNVNNRHVAEGWGVMGWSPLRKLGGGGGCKKQTKKELKEERERGSGKEMKTQ